MLNIYHNAQKPNKELAMYNRWNVQHTG